MQGRKGAEVAAQKLVDSGEAATLKEAYSLRARKAAEAAAQIIVDSGEAATLEEAWSMIGRKGAEAAAQKLVDSGEAATLKEAYSLQARKGAEAAAQKLVDSGDVATLEEAYSLQGRIRAEAAAQTLVDSGEAATLEEAYSLQGRRAQRGLVDKHGKDALHRMQSDRSVRTAKQRGLRTKYPGVRWQKKQDRKTHKSLDEGPVDPEMTRGFWRVCFSYQGKFYSVGSGYANEEEAARAHDAYVRANGMSRRLHFPDERDGSNATDATSNVHRLRGGALIPYRKSDIGRAMDEFISFVFHPKLRSSALEWHGARQFLIDELLGGALTPQSLFVPVLSATLGQCIVERVLKFGLSQHLNVSYRSNSTLLRSAVIAPVGEEVKFRLGLHYPCGWLFVHGLVQIIPRSTVVAAYAFLIPLSDRLLAHLIGHMPPLLSSVILRARGLYATRLFPICVYASALTFARALVVTSR